MTAAVVLSDVHVTFGEGPNSVRALRGIDLQVAAGEFLTIIGSNGAGKSTVINALAGSVRPQRGTISIGGKDVAHVAEHRRAAGIAQVRQDAGASVCTEMTVEENLILAMKRGARRSPLRRARSAASRQEARKAMTEFGAELADRLPTQAGLLSGGQRQLVALAMATCASPQVLLLDEHTSALDPKMAEAVMVATDDVVRRNDLTAVMVTHNIAHAARFGDRLAIMSSGRVVDTLTRAECEELGESGLIQRFRSAVDGGVSDSMLA